ncbi:hypothetical protein, unlikely [Trypanosoma brucei gambiense DAL972]|uniref:Uncharacterized protein n=1 Tax=Trypanosoma brucei gambiense (strain MHOM/CI/86/DAL972) TaxID=679716 RepID=D0A2Q2_TRYB9|nr:hypothetical protein, unlikely [Trypanosoma brucei gambiense DAL972]CBH15546.1 hypothetical protein, unlikely [Trypanosoma brucei gambiense DAL972]|eukprot:XP_011777810.1 hypothetical protein, unlikely [Trypanosoma brucei gambiense DAL972]
MILPPVPFRFLDLTFLTYFFFGFLHTYRCFPSFSNSVTFPQNFATFGAFPLAALQPQIRLSTYRRLPRTLKQHKKRGKCMQIYKDIIICIYVGRQTDNKGDKTYIV